MWYTLIRLVVNSIIWVFMLINRALLVPNNYAFWLIAYLFYGMYLLQFALFGGWERFIVLLLVFYPFLCCIISVPNWLTPWYYIVYMYIVAGGYLIHAHICPMNFLSIFYYFLVFYYLIFCVGLSNVLLGLLILNIWYRGPQLRRFFRTVVCIIINLNNILIMHCVMKKINKTNIKINNEQKQV